MFFNILFKINLNIYTHTYAHTHIKHKRHKQQIQIIGNEMMFGQWSFDSWVWTTNIGLTSVLQVVMLKALYLKPPLDLIL